jgi:hypothetical protein
MSEHPPTISLRERFRWWFYARCFAYCVRCVYPDADPSEFSILDDTNFLAVNKGLLRMIVEEAPEIAWHFEHELVS